MKNGPNLERARQFYEMITTREALLDQARRFYRIPTRTDIARAELPEWVRRDSIRTMPVDWERLAREGPQWMQYWDENIKGRGEAYLRALESRTAAN